MSRHDPARRVISKMDLPSDSKELASDSKKLLKEILKEMVGSDYYGSARLKTVADLKDLEVMLDAMSKALEPATTETAKADEAAEDKPAATEASKTTVTAIKAAPTEDKPAAEASTEPTMKELTLEEFQTYAADRLAKALLAGDAEKATELQKQIGEVRDELTKFEDTDVIRIQTLVDPDYTGPTSAEGNPASVTQGSVGSPSHEAGSTSGVPTPAEPNATVATPSPDQGAPATNATTTKAIKPDADPEAAEKSETKDFAWPDDFNTPGRTEEWGKDNESAPSTE